MTVKKFKYEVEMSLTNRKGYLNIDLDKDGQTVNFEQYHNNHLDSGCTFGWYTVGGKAVDEEMLTSGIDKQLMIEFLEESLKLLKGNS
ncbi:hypothetical protein NVP1170O_197 [Vibrio phage 1.170.O._10N.261.52.C3]|nr:hypothetical protein NVP1170O_197 [Vibrio phage 1.170.O._10N.261.52.C3]